MEGDRTLSTLLLAYCEIGDEGGKAFYKALKTNTSLMTLHITNNLFSDKLLLAITKLMEAEERQTPNVEEPLLEMEDAGGEGKPAKQEVIEITKDDILYGDIEANQQGPYGKM